MTENQKAKFISQCVAMTPCPNPDNHRINNEGTSCLVCKLTVDEILAWEETSYGDREVICNEILER
jgi:predicted Fe-S protein YdhL (DUF1289 family)